MSLKFPGKNIALEIDKPFPIDLSTNYLEYGCFLLPTEVAMYGTGILCDLDSLPRSTSIKPECLADPHQILNLKFVNDPSLSSGICETLVLEQQIQIELAMNPKVAIEDSRLFQLHSGENGYFYRLGIPDAMGKMNKYRLEAQFKHETETYSISYTSYGNNADAKSLEFRNKLLKSRILSND